MRLVVCSVTGTKITFSRPHEHAKQNDGKQIRIGWKWFNNLKWIFDEKPLEAGRGQTTGLIVMHENLVFLVQCVHSWCAGPGVFGGEQYYLENRENI